MQAGKGDSYARTHCLIIPSSNELYWDRRIDLFQLQDMERVIMVSYCRHCGRFCETSNSVLSMGNDYWVHIGSGLSVCSWPIELRADQDTFAAPISQPLFSPIDGAPLIWKAN